MGKNFKHSLNNLPDSLRCIIFPYEYTFNKPITKYPKSLKIIKIHDSNIIKKFKIKLPKNIKIYDFNYKTTFILCICYYPVEKLNKKNYNRKKTFN